MAESEKRNHWAELVSAMGITPAPEPPKKETESEIASVGPPPSVPRATPKVDRPAPAKKAANWDQLASELGLAPPPPVKPEEPSREVIAAAPLPVESIPVPSATAPEPGEAWESAQTEVENPLFLDVPGTETPEPDHPTEPIETAAESDRVPGKSGRRRRRRRKSRRGAPPSSTAGAPGGAGALQSEPAPAGDEESDSDEWPLDSAEPEPAGEQGTSERRGRRRRRRRRPDSRSAGPAAPRRPPSDAPPNAMPDDADDADVEPQPADHDDEDDAKADKLSHRAVPTWEEAIGLMISKNLDARAKNPNAGNSARGRGGHRRGRDRGRSRS